jgi:hypothetical protein
MMHMTQIGDPELLQGVDPSQAGKGLHASAQDGLLILSQRFNRWAKSKPFDLIPPVR